MSRSPRILLDKGTYASIAESNKSWTSPFPLLMLVFAAETSWAEDNEKVAVEDMKRKKKKKKAKKR